MGVNRAGCSAHLLPIERLSQHGVGAAVSSGSRSCACGLSEPKFFLIETSCIVFPLVVYRELPIKDL